MSACVYAYAHALSDDSVRHTRPIDVICERLLSAAVLLYPVKVSEKTPIAGREGLPEQSGNPDMYSDHTSGSCSRTSQKLHTDARFDS